MRHSCDLYHHLHGLDSCHHSLAKTFVYCACGVSRLRIARWDVSLLSTNKGTRWGLVHACTRCTPLYCVRLYVFSVLYICFPAAFRSTGQVPRAICSRYMSYKLLSPEDRHADSDIQYGVMGKKISGGQKPLTGCRSLVSLLERIMVGLFRSPFSLAAFHSDQIASQACFTQGSLLVKCACMFTIVLI